MFISQSISDWTHFYLPFECGAANITSTYISGHGCQGCTDIYCEDCFFRGF